MAKIQPAETAPCFCCEKEITSSMTGDSPWNGPGHGVRFSADGLFGSGFYDSLTEEEGVALQLIICDECLENNKARARKVKYTTAVTQQIIADVTGIAEDEIAQRIAEDMKEKDKLKDTFSKVKTGRVSCEHPNESNKPKSISDDTE